MAAWGTRKLKIFVGSTPVEVTAQVSRVAVTSGETDSDFVSFAQAAAGGGRDYVLEMTFTQDPATDTLWDRVWAHAGEDVAVRIYPGGYDPTTNPVSATNPAYDMVATIVEPDGDLLGGEADSSTTNKFTVEVAWPLAAKPVKDTTP